ncbi:PREDICTED: uncharacterized protein LOC109226226 [Nicotiana attenuata]|uniref:uncharacterized protein LOC109226226 n=1 Tax=Nicotiana attenuata TaxID=49451 RepID=UPI000905A92D|nr:PREDICTED: uncharacterized protein LOC109226226 [Nicotiana attenuata]
MATLAEFWYNSNYHSSLKVTPFKVMYGYDPPQLSFELVSQNPIASINQVLKERQLMTKILNGNLEKAQNKIKLLDKKRTEREFEAGDWVFLKLQLYRQTLIAIEKMAYKLELPPTDNIHPLFYISQLKKKIGPHVVPAINPPICSLKGQPLVEPRVVLDRRMIKKWNKAATQIWFSGLIYCLKKPLGKIITSSSPVSRI